MEHYMKRVVIGFLLLGSAFPATSVSSQVGRSVTAADYARAEKFLAQNLNGLVVGGAVSPTWLPDGRFWYRNTTPAGSEIVVIDPAKKSRERCDAQATTCAGANIPPGAQGAGGRGGRGGGRGGAPGGSASKGEPLSLSPDGK